MAMEKLILRSVMYGADKIPDKWFEKIPGGYYKAKEKEEEKKESIKEHLRGDERKSRRATYDDGYRSEGERRRHHDRRSRSSYDGVDEEKHRRDDDRKPRHEKSHRRRRSLDGGDRSRDEDRRRRRSRDKHDDKDRDRRRDRPSPPNAEKPKRATTDERPPNPFRPAIGAMGAGAVAGAARPPWLDSSRPGTAGSTTARNGYTPYSHIYGDSAPQSPRYAQTPPPMSPVDRTASPQSYQQNPFAQDAPTAAAAGAGAAYDGESRFIPQDPRAYGYDPRHDPRLAPARNDPSSPPPDRQGSRDERRSERAGDGRSRSER